MTPPNNLNGLRILVVEDDMMIAMFIEDVLQDMGCVVVGPVGRLDLALQLAADEDLDAGILDVTIRGGAVFPVAELLRAHGIPFALASGYGDWALPPFLQGQSRLMKPFTVDELEAQVQALCNGLPPRQSADLPT